MKQNYCKIIPCLDIKDGRVVKGVKFTELRDAGDPAEIAEFYSNAGADEVVFLDIAATVEGRGTMLEVIRKASAKVNCPITVGGGIRSIEDARAVIAAGASKVGVNSAAVKRPQLICEIAAEFDVVVAIDSKRSEDGKYLVCTDGGFKLTNLDAVAWARQCSELGAKEILLTSFDEDGTKSGYDLEMTRAVADAVSSKGVPVTASGGAGSLEHIYAALTVGGASNALVASLFHFNELTIPQVKAYLKEKGVKVNEAH